MKFSSSQNPLSPRSRMRVELRHRSGPTTEDIKPASQPVFYCHICGQIFSAQGLLKEHRWGAHRQKKEGRHSCRYCPYSNNIKSHVTMHERTHTGERPFACHICGKGFALQNTLTRHQLVHSGEKPYECADCGQCFSQVASLVRHRRGRHVVDGEVTLHVCPRCGKQSSRWDNFKRHLRSHMGEKPHACSQCGKRFTQRSSATLHERVLHCGQYPVHCPHCGKALWNVTNLRRHVRARHADAR